MINRDAIKKLNDMTVDSQYAQQLGIKVFNGQANAVECSQLQDVAEDLIESINAWKDLIQLQISN